MTGSIRAFLYEDDFGTLYGVRKDESAAEATLSNGSTLYNNYTSGTPAIRTGLKQRYVNTVLSTDPSIKRKFEIGRMTVFNSIVAGTTITEAAGGLAAGGTYNVLSKVGEKSRFLTVADTGQLDGDNP